jgi:type IV pilus assembly protein PilA
MRQSRGFTLIELMIVVAIIAILASIAISVYVDSTGKAQLSEAFTVTDGLRTDVSDYYAQNGSCPTLGADGLSSAASYSGKYVADVSIASGGAGCAITAYMRTSSITPGIQGTQVIFTMAGSGASISWQCSSNANPVYVPAACQQ